MVKICRVIRIKLNQLVKENVRTIAILLRKWRLLTSEEQIFRRACPTKWRKTADTKKLRHCHPMYWNREGLDCHRFNAPKHSVNFLLKAYIYQSSASYRSIAQYKFLVLKEEDCAVCMCPLNSAHTRGICKIPDIPIPVETSLGWSTQRKQ